MIDTELCSLICNVIYVYIHTYVTYVCIYIYVVNIFLECASFALLLTPSVLSDQISSLHQLLVQKPFRAGDAYILTKAVF